MDQVRIGRFIRELRLERGLKQRELADQLGIADKTVSKWECGNGLPEVSLMLPLCTILGISVNELLSGERLGEESYRDHAEENIVNIMKEYRSARKNHALSNVVALLGLFSGLSIIFTAAFVEMDSWARIFLISVGFVSIMGLIFVACALDSDAGSFVCPTCGNHIVPTTSQYINSPHMSTTRYLFCPICGKRRWCKKYLPRPKG
jgi:transcriptional regulator with XRE-family HTH domain/DNA-directed RNA polymerase subunit RPC12/RpoP